MRCGGRMGGEGRGGGCWQCGREEARRREGGRWGTVGQKREGGMGGEERRRGGCGRRETLADDGMGRNRGVGVVYLAEGGGGGMRAWLTWALPPRRLLWLSAGPVDALAQGRRKRPRGGVQGADRARGGREGADYGDKGSGTGRRKGEVGVMMRGNGRGEGGGRSCGGEIGEGLRDGRGCHGDISDEMRSADGRRGKGRRVLAVW